MCLFPSNIPMWEHDFSSFFLSFSQLKSHYLPSWWPKKVPSYLSIEERLSVFFLNFFNSGISFFFFVQNFVWKNYPLFLVKSTSNFAWSLFWRKFSSRVIYFCQFFSASKIFVKLLFVWVGLDVFPFKMMKKKPAIVFSMLKALGIDHQVLLDAYVLV